ncbi:MAG: hypothetical protein JJU03_10495 [Idiomarina sp.]|nr:hypothetical protein [Idiomarina sp.]
MTYLPRCLTTGLILLSAACAAADTPDEQGIEGQGQLIGTLTTPEYQVALYSGCAEGEVSCDQISAQLQQPGSEARELNGSTMHTLCADGMTPCRFLGYYLSDQDYAYRILENGQLHIKQCSDLGCEDIYNVRGSWHY